MQNWMSALLGAIALACMATGSGQDTERTPDAERVVLGTFDSRAVAVAYVRSERFAAKLSDLRSQLEEAREAGDQERVEELEATGPRLQQTVHRQAFGAAPAEDILGLIQDALPGLADAAGVDVIVSKWSLAFQRDSVRGVDVTDQLVEVFEPDEATLAVIRDLLQQAPIPLEDLDHG